MYAVQIAIALNKSGQFSAAVFKPSIYLIAFALKLILAMQFCSALFRSTSAVEIKEGLDFIEKRMRVFIKKLPLCKNMSQKPKYSETLSFFLNFIAQISALWEKLNFAWRARGGKEGLKKILILLPVLFSIAFKNADDKRKSLLSRQK
jgi:biotin transport system permease protein/energy-coupling factor transport system permease protein